MSQELTGMMLQEIESRLVQMVGQAGQMALEWFWRPLQVEYKQMDRMDPVTQADREVESFLRSAIASEFPDHAILGEEGTELEVSEREYLWVVDPVDGTSNFVNGFPLFACSVALLRNMEPVVGALFLPVSPRVSSPAPAAGVEPRASVARLGSGVLHARLGGGAYLDGIRVQASEAEEPEPSSLSGLPGLHAHHFHRRDRLRRSPGELRCTGSVCFEAAMVATGVFRYAVFRSPKLWDVAAATLIVREAGGTSLRWRGAEWEPLTRFEPMSNPKDPREKGFRFWRAVTLMGGSRVARFVAERLRPVLPPDKAARRATAE
ncbi:MAG: inositol monophosphatase family protein [Sphingomonadaceae bacterium]